MSRASDVARAVGELRQRVTRLEARAEPPLTGTFVDTATSASDDLRVIAPGYDGGEHSFGPVAWSPIGNSLPTAGDECVIVERDDGVWQVVAWSSAAQTVDPGPEAVRLVGALGQPAFTNSWVNFDADRATGFYKDRGHVFLTGDIKSGTIGQSAFTLPVGYRPAAVNGLLFPVVSNNLFGYVTVKNDGTVTPTAGSNVYVSLDGISFRAA